MNVFFFELIISASLCIICGIERKLAIFNFIFLIMFYQQYVNADIREIYSDSGIILSIYEKLPVLDVLVICMGVRFKYIRTTFS